jgi:hypothetical protein
VAQRATHRLAQVFVVGPAPTITYTPREESQLETRVADYVEERGRILVVTGPSKSGKTVLLRRTLPDAVWVTGGQVRETDDLWRLVVDGADGWTGELREHVRTDTESTSSGTTAQFKPMGVGADTALSDSSSVADASRHLRSAERDPLSVAQTLLASVRRVLVIDDFHHVAPAVQRIIIRQLKPLIERGAGVVLVAVPHRAADVVVAEGEMDGRVERLQIGLWHEAELMDIAHKGFLALAVEPKVGLPKRLATLSHRSPHLMQLLCREICKAGGVRSTASSPQTLVEPANWDDFLSVVAVRYTHDETYRSLVRGPQTRKDRVERRMRSSSQTTDIYGAVMAALSTVSPDEEVEYNTLRDALRRLLEELPPKEQVTNALRHMSEIAGELARDEHGRLRRDPVLEWRQDRDTLYVADPFFAFRLCFGPAVLRGGSTEGSPRVGEERTPMIETPQE